LPHVSSSKNGLIQQTVPITLINTFLYAKTWAKTFGGVPNVLVAKFSEPEYLNRICVFMSKMCAAGVFRLVFLQGFFEGPKRFHDVFSIVWLPFLVVHTFIPPCVPWFGYKLCWNVFDSYGWENWKREKKGPVFKERARRCPLLTEECSLRVCFTCETIEDLGS
jgi:hypothetical protein